MKKTNLETEQKFNTEFFKEILEQNEEEAEKTLILLKNTVSSDVLKKINYFIEFISKDEQFCIQFNKHMESKK